MNSFKLPNRVVTDKKLSYSARHIAAIMYMIQEQEGSCVRGLYQLCEISSYSIVTVVKSISQLRQQGYLSVQHGKKGNRNCVNSYHMQTNEWPCTDISPKVFAEGARNMRVVIYLYLLIQANGAASVTISTEEIKRGLQLQGDASIRVGLNQLEAEGYIERIQRFRQPEVWAKTEYVLKIR